MPSPSGVRVAIYEFRGYIFRPQQVLILIFFSPFDIIRQPSSCIIFFSINFHSVARVARIDLSDPYQWVLNFGLLSRATSTFRPCVTGTCSLLTSPVSPTLQLFVIIRRTRKLRSVTHATASRNWQNLDPNLGLAPKPGLKPLHRSTEDMGTGFAREGPALSGGGEGESPPTLQGWGRGAAADPPPRDVP